MRPQLPDAALVFVPAGRIRAWEKLEAALREGKPREVIDALLAELDELPPPAWPGPYAA